MQIRRSAVVYISQDSMILSSQVNCTGTHLRGRTLLIRKLGRSECQRRAATVKYWSQSTAMIDYEFGSPFIASLLGESANWPAAARAFGEPRGCVPGPPHWNIWSRRTTMMNSLVGSSFTARHRGVSSKNQRRGARAFLGLLGAAAPSGQVAEARSRAFLACRSGLQQPQWSVLRFWWRSPQIILRSVIFLIRKGA